MAKLLLVAVTAAIGVWGKVHGEKKKTATGDPGGERSGTNCWGT